MVIGSRRAAQPPRSASVTGTPGATWQRAKGEELAWPGVECGMTERCEDLDHVYPVAYGVPDTPRAVDSDALAFWQQITSSTLSEGRHGPACEFATLLPGNGDPYLRVQAVVGNRAECHPKEIGRASCRERV